MSELLIIEQNVIAQAFATTGGTDALFERIAQEARSFVPDLTTKKGRDAIGALAMKVSKSKVVAEQYAKELVAEQKAKIKLVDDDRLNFARKMDSLRDEILAPREAWEQAEKDRVAQIKQSIEGIKSYAHLSADATAADIQEALSIIELIIVDSKYQEYEDAAKLVRLETIDTLRKSLAARQKYEADQAELARLRAEAAERARIEYEQRIADAAAAKARAEAEAQARAESDRVEREKREAIEQAERQQREAAEREARLIAEADNARLREEKAKADAAEAKKHAKIVAQQAIERERLRQQQEAEKQRIADERALQKRIADMEHIRAINQTAVAALIASSGITAEQAELIIRAIHAGSVPAVSIQY